MNKVQTYCDIINNGIREAPRRLDITTKQWHQIYVIEYGNQVAFIESYNAIPQGDRRHYIVIIDQKEIPRLIQFLQELQSEEVSDESKTVCTNAPIDYPGGSL